MTSQEVYNFAFRYPARMCCALAGGFGEDRFLELLRVLAYEDGLRGGQLATRRVQ